MSSNQPTQNLSAPVEQLDPTKASNMYHQDNNRSMQMFQMMPNQTQNNFGSTSNMADSTVSTYHNLSFNQFPQPNLNKQATPTNSFSKVPTESGQGIQGIHEYPKKTTEESSSSATQQHDVSPVDGSTTSLSSGLNFPVGSMPSSDIPVVPQTSSTETSDQTGTLNAGFNETMNTATATTSISSDTPYYPNLLSSTTNPQTSGLMSLQSLSSFQSPTSATFNSLTGTAVSTKPDTVFDETMQTTFMNCFIQHQSQLRNLSSNSQVSSQSLIDLLSTYPDINTPIPCPQSSQSAFTLALQQNTLLASVYQLACSFNTQAIRFLLRIGLPLNFFPTPVQVLVLQTLSNVPSALITTVASAAATNTTDPASAAQSAITSYYANFNSNSLNSPMYPYSSLSNPYPTFGSPIFNNLNPNLNSMQTKSPAVSGKGSGNKTGKRAMLPKTGVEVLYSWFQAHADHPYPTDREKELLATQANLAIKQVNYWFINARVRLWKKKDKLRPRQARNSMSEASEGGDGEMANQDEATNDSTYNFSIDTNEAVDANTDDQGANDTESDSKNADGSDMVDGRGKRSRKSITSAGSETPPKRRRGASTNTSNTQLSNNTSTPTATNRRGRKANTTTMSQQQQQQQSQQHPTSLQSPNQSVDTANTAHTMLLHPMTNLSFGQQSQQSSTQHTQSIQPIPQPHMPHLQPALHHAGNNYLTNSIQSLAMTHSNTSSMHKDDIHSELQSLPILSPNKYNVNMSMPLNNSSINLKKD